MQKTKAVVTIFLFLLLFLMPSTGHGLDTDLYVLTGVNVPPNVLIILDSSASMSEVSSGQNYDPGINYSIYNPPTAYPLNALYVKTGGNKWTPVTDSNGDPIDYTTSPLVCDDLRYGYLAPSGQAINYTGCGYTRKDFQTGNFRNFLQLTGGPGGDRSRFGLATGIIHSYINTVSGVRFAVMAFNRDSAIPPNTVKYDFVNK